MKTSSVCLLLCAALWLAGCSGRSSHVEQRVVELPGDNPLAGLSTAAEIARSVQAAGLSADLQKQFPSLTPEQLQGVYVNWSIGYFHGKQAVALMTGIRYRGSLPEAKAVADYCESRFKTAVAAKFSALNSK